MGIVKIIPTPVKNLFVIELESLEDKRGKFVRIFCQRELQQAGLIENIVYGILLRICH